jgi:serine/threonine protein phosphatase PrpC
MRIKIKILLLLSMNCMHAAEQFKKVIGLFQHQGNRVTQEDRWFYKYIKSEDKAIDGGHLLGVLDGFNGSAVAHQATITFPSIFKGCSGTIEERFKKSFENFDQSLDGIPDKKCGATATIIFIKDGVMHCGQLGSTRAIGIKQENKSWLVDFTTKEHMPNDPEEKNRIETAGGYVGEYSKVWRVEGYLTSSRAFGCSFGDMKKYIIAEPTYTQKKIEEDQSYAVIATDGLWGVKSNADVLSTMLYAIKSCGTVVGAHKVAWVLGQKSVHTHTENMTILVIDLLQLAQSNHEQKVEELVVDLKSLNL